MKKLTFSSVLLLIAACVFAQDTSRTVTTITYSKVGFEKTSRDREIFNLIKINPLAIVLGDIPFTYERRVTDNVSVLATLGMTHADYIYEAIHEGYGYDVERNYNLGYLFGVGINYYPSQNTPALEEFYFGADFKFRHFSSEAQACTDVNWLEEKRNTFDAQIIFGYIHFVSDCVFFDFYGGFGMRKRYSERASCDQSGPIDVSVIDVTDNAIPIGSGGFRLGFAF